MYNGYFCIWKFLQCDPDEVANYIVFPILMIAFYLYVSIYIYIYCDCNFYSFFLSAKFCKKNDQPQKIPIIPYAHNSNKTISASKIYKSVKIAADDIDLLEHSMRCSTSPVFRSVQRS